MIQTRYTSPHKEREEGLGKMLLFPKTQKLTSQAVGPVKQPLPLRMLFSVTKIRLK